MPESVEVRKFADILLENVLDKHITHINILKGRYTKKVFEGYNELIKALPLTIESIDTKGKFTYMKLVSHKNNSYFYLFNTLGLSGGWTLKSNKKTNFAKCNHCNYMQVEKSGIHDTYTILEYINEDSQNQWFQRALNHLNVEFITDYKNISFYFYDQLSFGTLKAVGGKDGKDGKDNSGDLILEKKLKELGPDLLHESITFELFKTQIRKKVNENKPIGNVIVNQKIISGVGNYLRADALWMAKISPFRKVVDIKNDNNDAELHLLYTSLIGLIWGDYDYKNGINKGHISKSLKLPNNYNRDFFIYRQEHDINGNKVKKEELYEGSQKRFIYWVEKIQK